jgi:hypothetical protein
MPKAAPQVELNKEQVEAIQTWNQAKQQLDAAKADELTKRNAAIQCVPFSAEKDEGAQTVKLGGGWSLKLDRPMNYSITRNNEQVTAALVALAEVNPSAARELIRWQAEISTKVYRDLSDAEKLIVAPILTIKPGTPALELKPPTPSKEQRAT